MRTRLFGSTERLPSLPPANRSEPTDIAVPRQSVWISHLTYCNVS